MTTLKLLIVFLLIAYSSWGQESKKKMPDPAAIALNNKAMALVPYIDNTDSAVKALSLLDEATKVDSNYYLGYNNKLMFLSKLKKFDKAVFTTNKMIGLRPHAHDLYILGGILYERVGDTAYSRNFFQKSLMICNAALDTMMVKNRDYDILSIDKAINLIMLGDLTKGNELLKQIYDRQPEEFFKELTLSLMNQSKEELIKHFTEDKYGH